MGSHYSRRRLLQGVGAVALSVALVGCVGDDESDEPTGDGADDQPGADPEEHVTISDDFHSYVLESTVTIESPEGDVTTFQEMVQWDDDNERAFVQRTLGEDEDVAALHFYRIGNAAYQVLPDGTCAEANPATVEQQAELISRQAGDFRIPTEDDFDDGMFAYEGTQTVEGVGADKWVANLGDTIDFDDGVFEVYIATETNYLVRLSGWYPIGHVDNPGKVTFEQNYHSFNEVLDIEVPDECDD